MMTTAEIQERLLFLQQQGRDLKRAEDELKIKRALIKVRSFHEAQIGTETDQSILSKKLDCLTFLIEN